MKVRRRKRIRLDDGHGKTASERGLGRRDISILAKPAARCVFPVRGKGKGNAVYSRLTPGLSVLESNAASGARFWHGAYGSIRRPASLPPSTMRYLSRIGDSRTPQSRIRACRNGAESPPLPHPISPPTFPPPAFQRTVPPALPSHFSPPFSSPIPLLHPTPPFYSPP